MKPLKTKVSLTLDNNLLEALKKMAENDDRSLSQYVNMALKKWVTSNTVSSSLRQPGNSGLSSVNKR